MIDFGRTISFFETLHAIMFSTFFVKYSQQLVIDLDYLGCYVDRGVRDISGSTWNANNMSPGICIQSCIERKFEYAGVQVCEINRVMSLCKNFKQILAEDK